MRFAAADRAARSNDRLVVIVLMATQADVRHIALSFPDARESSGRFAFAVPNKGKLKEFVWVWLERLDPKNARVPN